MLNQSAPQRSAPEIARKETLHKSPVARLYGRHRHRLPTISSYALAKFLFALTAGQLLSGERPRLSVVNSYLLTSRCRELIDTGFGKDRGRDRGQIEQLIAPGLPFPMFPLRLNEIHVDQQCRELAGHFNIETCYTSNPDAALWFDFGAKAEGRDILKIDEGHGGDPGGHDRLGQSGRSIDVMQGAAPPIARAGGTTVRDPHVVFVGHVPTSGAIAEPAMVRKPTP